jgi:hypothetical protein
MIDELPNPHFSRMRAKRHVDRKKDVGRSKKRAKLPSQIRLSLEDVLFPIRF